MSASPGYEGWEDIYLHCHNSNQNISTMQYWLLSAHDITLIFGEKWPNKIPPVLISPLLTKLWVLGISREIVQTNCFSVQSCWLEYTGFRKWRFFTCAPAILLIKCIKKDCTLAFPCHVIPVFHISYLGIHFQRTRCQIAQIYQWQI